MIFIVLFLNQRFWFHALYIFTCLAVLVSNSFLLRQYAFIVWANKYGLAWYALPDKVYDLYSIIFKSAFLVSCIVYIYLSCSTGLKFFFITTICDTACIL